MSPIRSENRDRYPADWADLSARIRFGRAASQCECDGRCGTHHPAGRCTARHDQPHPITHSRVVLTVAHLDHTPENCDPENLRAMCQRCHLHYDAEHHAQTRRTTSEAAWREAGQGSLLDTEGAQHG